LHQLVFVIELGTGQVKQTLHIDQHFGSIPFKDFVRRFGRIEIDFVLQSRAAAANDFYSQSLPIPALSRNQLFDPRHRTFRQSHPRRHG